MSYSENEWLTTVEVAELLGRSDRWVRDRVKDGSLPAALGGGGKRKSYKIHREAVALMLLTEGKASVPEVAKVMEGMDEEMLAELSAAITTVLEERRTKGIAVVEKCEAIYRPVGDLMGRQLPVEFKYGEGPYRRYFDNPALLMAAAYDRLNAKVEGVLAVAVTSVNFYEEILRGVAKDDYHPACEKGQTPILCLDTLILNDPIWAGFLFKTIGATIKKYCGHHSLHPQAAFAVASATAAVAMLENFGFKKSGMFGKYPVMLCKNVLAGKLGRYLR